MAGHRGPQEEVKTIIAAAIIALIAAAPAVAATSIAIWENASIPGIGPAPVTIACCCLARFAAALDQLPGSSSQANGCGHS